jgi:predicted nucleic acid-binding protein
MQHHPGATLLTDDSVARLVALQMGFKAYGTLGVVLRSLERRQRTKRQVLNLLRAVPRRSTLFVRVDFLESLIQYVEEMD